MATFFASWQLWEQMTFVLALFILGVFAIGLVRLQRINHKMRKQEVLDEEKRARIQEIRKAGVPLKRHGVPFGIRAIQHGVEVDGIWISRPTTPVTPPEPTATSATATTATAANVALIGTSTKGASPVEPRQDSNTARTPPVTPVRGPLQIPQLSSPFQPPGSDSRSLRTTSSTLDPDGPARGSCDGDGSLQPKESRLCPPYLPTGSSLPTQTSLAQYPAGDGRQGWPRGPDIGLGDEIELSAQLEDMARPEPSIRVRTRSYTSSRSSRLFATAHEDQLHSAVSQQLPDEEVRGEEQATGTGSSILLETTSYAPSSNHHHIPGLDLLHSTVSAATRRIPPPPDQPVESFPEPTALSSQPGAESYCSFSRHQGGRPATVLASATELGSPTPPSTQCRLFMPEPTFGPGELHINRTSRRVNRGFEVMPAGTFGTPHEFRTTKDEAQERAAASSNSHDGNP